MHVYLVQIISYVLLRWPNDARIGILTPPFHSFLHIFFCFPPHAPTFLLQLGLSGAETLTYLE